MEKTTKRTPTPRQRKAAKAIVENLLKDKPLPTGQVLENVGYGEIVKDPQRITQSAGFQEALADIGLRQALIAKGITPERIAEKIDVLLDATEKTILGTELINSPDYTAIDKGLKHATAIYGITEEPNKPKTQTTYNFIFSPEIQADVKEIEARIKARLINSNVSENKESIQGTDQN